LFVLLM